MKTFQGHREWVRKVRVSPDGKLCNHSDVFCLRVHVIVMAKILLLFNIFQTGYVFLSNIQK